MSDSDYSGGTSAAGVSSLTAGNGFSVNASTGAVTGSASIDSVTLAFSSAKIQVNEFLDARQNLTVADAAPTTLLTAGAGQAYMVALGVLNTAGTGGSTYTISWQEGGVTYTLGISATGTGVTSPANAVRTFQPDNGTAVTVQLTACAAGNHTDVIACAQRVK